MPTRILTATLFLTICMTSFAAGGNGQARYVFPTNLAMTLSPSGAMNQSRTGTMNGRVTSRLGTLRQLHVFFECSPDLVVNPRMAELFELAEAAGNPTAECPGFKTFTVTVSKGRGKPDEMGSWIRMRVRYLPDFDRIGKALENKTIYPIDYERQRLLGILARNRKAQSPYTDAIRFFLK